MEKALGEASISFAILRTGPPWIFAVFVVMFHVNRDIRDLWAPRSQLPSCPLASRTSHRRPALLRADARSVRVDGAANSFAPTLLTSWR